MTTMMTKLLSDLKFAEKHGRVKARTSDVLKHHFFYIYEYFFLEMSLVEIEFD
jgi:hypothetical protein